MSTAASRPIAPAEFCGVQECAGLCPDIPLFTLTAAIEGHPVGSTVSAQTLERLGYQVPPMTEAKS